MRLGIPSQRSPSSGRSRGRSDPTAAAGRWADTVAGLHLTAEVDTVGPAEWDRIVLDFDDISYDQTALFAAGVWRAERVSHLLLRQDGIPVAGAIVAILRLPGISRGLAWCRFGPFWRRRDADADVTHYAAMVAAMEAEYVVRRRHHLTIQPRPSPEFHDSECAILSDFGFAVRRPPRDPNRYLVDLSLAEAEQMASLDQKWRYNLRQSLANGFDIGIAQDDEAIDIFARLHETMVARKRFLNTDRVDLLPRLREQLPEAIRPVAILAHHEGKPVAGAIIGMLGDTAYYLYGASDTKALPLKPGYALQWQAVKWLREQGVRWYDLGGEVEEPGLRQFKKGMVGKRGTVLSHRGEFDRWTDPGARWAAELIFAIRAARRLWTSRRSRSP